jgi:serine/threonine-protein kinase RsbW
MKTIIFPGRYACLADIREYVGQSAKNAGFNEKDIYAVELAVDEACSNIIEHAYGGEDKGEIECTCDVQKNGDLVVHLKDHGHPFDPVDVPDPNFTVDLEKLKPRGAGMFLMRKMMDEISYHFHIGQGNTLTLVKRKTAKRKEKLHIAN